MTDQATVEATPAPEQAPVEQTVETQVEPQEEDVDLSSRFAALTRKEKSLLEQQRELKERIKYAEEYENAKKNAKMNPKAAMESLGLTYEELTNFILNDEQPDETTKVNTKIEALEKMLEDERNARLKEKEDAQTQAQQQLVEEYRGKMYELASSDENYELVHTYGDEGQDLAFKIAEAHYEQNSEVLPPEQALKLAEEYLENELKNKFVNTKKVKAMLGLTETKEEPKPTDVERDITLTNEVQSTSSFDSMDYIEDDEASKRRAAEMLAKSLRS